MNARLLNLIEDHRRQGSIVQNLGRGYTLRFEHVAVSRQGDRYVFLDTRSQKEHTLAVGATNEARLLAHLEGFFSAQVAA